MDTEGNQWPVGSITSRKKVLGAAAVAPAMAGPGISRSGADGAALSAVLTAQEPLHSGEMPFRE